MSKLIIDLLSDTHNQHGKFNCEGGDILLHSGDFTGRGTPQEVQNFMLWMELQDYTHKVVIPGNHDWDLEKNFPYWRDEFAKRGIHLLNDSGVTLTGTIFPEGKAFFTDGNQFPTEEEIIKKYEIKVWGSPIQPWFHDWAFNRFIHQAQATRKCPWIKPHWDMIPEDTEILLTHGPPQNILDEVIRGGLNVGCPHLAKRIKETQVKLHLFGHIHEGRGFIYDGPVTYVNGSSLDHMYWPADNRPMRVIREIFQDGSIGYVL